MIGELSFADLAVIVVGISILVLIGLFGRSRENESDFYLASRNSKIFSAVMSFVATEISAMTIVGVPAVGFQDSWTYLQFFMGSAISRILIAFFFIPVFYNSGTVTIYEFISKRFSDSVRICVSVFFFITRIMASGVRLYAATMTISFMMDMQIELSILFFLVLSLFFISWGGMRSVMNNGTYQALMFYGVAAIVIAWGCKLSNHSLPSVISALYGEGKLKVFSLSGTSFDVFFLAFLNGVFGSFASFGTDYEMMQKLLTLKTRRRSQITLIWTIFASFILVVLYLMCGSVIYFFVRQSAVNYTGKSDEILGWFASNYMPGGLRGVVLLTVFLATVDLPLLSLSTSFVNDIYSVLRKNLTEIDRIKIARISMIFFALILGIIAFLTRSVSGILWFGFEVHGVTAGSMLGVFLLGMISKRNYSSLSVIFSMIFSSGLCLSFMILNRLQITNIPWSSFVIIGTLLSFLLPIILAVLPEKKVI